MLRPFSLPAHKPLAVHRNPLYNLPQSTTLGDIMKATIERATLLKSLGHVQSVVERRNTIPILSNVLIEASEEGGIRLMATDLDLQINETVEANVTQPGATTVSAGMSNDLEQAVAAGATHVRIGRAVLGDRAPNR